MMSDEPLRPAECDHRSLIWLAKWEPPGVPEMWCTECHLTDQFPVSWLTVSDFEIRVRVGGAEVVHLSDVY